jgi:GTP cyclohydrolase I
VNVQEAVTAVDAEPNLIELRRSTPTPEAAREIPAPAHRHAVEQRRLAPGDWRRFEAYLGEILAALGMDIDTPSTQETPTRFLKALYDATAGYDGDRKLLTAFPSESRRASEAAPSQIIEGPIPFYSLCEHHALPFYGVAHVGYIADEQIIGISKLTRLVRLFARRFTVQERLGEQIADTLAELVGARGVAVHLEASHLCTRMRGVEEGPATVTTFWRGAFGEPDFRQEFLAEVHSQRIRARQPAIS